MTILEMNHVSKAFGGSQALTDIHFSVEEGEIHALLGENGAGKSTLMNILTGVIPADSGSIRFLGRDYPTPTITQMEQAGIAFVHQELNVINDLTVADNIFLCRELKGPLGLLRQKEQVARARQLFEDLGVDMDPTIMVSELKTSEKQLLEICRALYMDAKLLILDEPTTAHWGFSADAIALAYDKTVTNTRKFSPAYMNKILMSWNEKGLHSLAEIREKDQSARSRSSSGSEPRPAESLGSLWDKVNQI